MVAAQPYFDDLVDVLWLEHSVLERLRYKLVLANLMLARGTPEQVAAATDEVEQVLEALHRVEAKRQAAAAAAARSHDMAVQDMTLQYLVEDGPAHLRDVFDQQRAAIFELATEIEMITRTNRRLSTVGLESIRAALGVAEPLTYDAAGNRDRSGELASRVVRVL